MNQLMYVPRDYTADSVLLRDHLQWTFGIPQRRIQQPTRPMRNHELHRCVCMCAQIALQPRQLARRPSVRPAVIEHREMRTTRVETVVRRMPGILLEETLRKGAPDIVIARRQIERDLAVRLEHEAQ